MLIIQTDVVVDQDLEKVIIRIDSSIEGTMSRAMSTLPEKLQLYETISRWNVLIPSNNLYDLRMDLLHEAWVR